MGYRIGTDHSYHKGVVDYDVMVPMSRFDILRAGYGITKDSVFDENRAGADGRIPWGAYWYYVNDVKPARQAEAFIVALGDNRGNLPLFADFESSEPGDYLGWKYWAVFMETAEIFAPEKELMIYTRSSYWSEHCNRWNMLLHLPSAAYFAKHRLWLAAYNDRPVEDQTVPYPFKRSDFIAWQYTDTYQNPETLDVTDHGIKREVARFLDLNKFVGTDEQWGEFIGGATLPTPEPDPEPPAPDVPMTATVLDGLKLSVREGPSTSHTKLTTIPGGTQVKVDEIIKENGNEWVQWTGYSAKFHNDIPYMTVEGASPEPPPAPEPVIKFPWDTFTVPDEGDFALVAHDFQTSSWNFLPRSHKKNLDYRKDPLENALPEMVKTAGPNSEKFMPLTKPYQQLWHDLLEWASLGYMTGEELKVAWLDLTANHRSFTDAHSANENGYNDLIYNFSINDKDPEKINRGPIEQKRLLSGGNLVKIRRRLGTQYEIYAVDPAGPVPTREYISSHPWLFGWATVETMTELPGNRWAVKPYPQIRIKGIKTGTPFLNIGKDGLNLVEKINLIPIQNGATYSPYIRS